ncbi:MAG TPA: SRPBCC family protein [Conexibacter sp.]|nr:SRPBCC family protein [Conexibacter sp.]
MDPVSSSVTIARPRAEVFAYLTDVASHAEFKDHYLVDWHMTREETAGAGAGARFRERLPLSRFGWGDYTLVDVEPPFRIVERGRGGKFNRVRAMGEWTLYDAPGGMTRVDYRYETQPAKLSDRLMELVAGRGWWKRKLGRALRRLQSILEEDRARGRRATIAAR